MTNLSLFKGYISRDSEIKPASGFYSGDLASLKLLLLVLKFFGLVLGYLKRDSNGCLQKGQMNEAASTDCIW